ncbi:hypothetical protein ZWY2020_050514 [Hordeum vulgare]|nr:hypothetical protein ZWY2020_050514 [Hordeum vulgare]
MVKGRTGQRVRLYVRGSILSFKRSASSMELATDAMELATGFCHMTEKASYFTNAEKLKVGYTSRTWIRRATSGEGVWGLKSLEW